MVRLIKLAFVAALFVSLSPASAEDVSPTVSKRIAKMMAKADGASADTAFKVGSVRDEYEIARALGLNVESQSLVIKKRPYDVLKGKDAAGNQRELWFDISTIYPMF
jgi:hypothetical protein